MSKKYQFDTLQVHAGQIVDSTTQSRALPLYQTSCYAFKDSKHGASLFDLSEAGNIYTRLQNPTSDVFEQRAAALEGGAAALATASGQAAQFLTIVSLLRCGDNLVTSPFLYGGTYNQFKISFKNIGIECRFATNDSAEEIEKQINEKTKLIYVESIGNPSFSVPDFEKISALAKKYDLPLVVDNTFGACGYICRPFDHGANIVLHSASKWIGGHGTAIGGVIIDGGNYNWDNGKFPQLSEPSEGYHGINFCKNFGNIAFIVKARVEALRDFGACQAPFNSYQFAMGLETLSLRVERQSQNCLAIAKYLEKHPKVEKVFYPGLENDQNNKNAKKYLQNGFGGALSFVLKGDKNSTIRFVDSLKLISHVANVGDNKTLIVQPAATTHQQLSSQEQLNAGVLPTLLRLSAGIENINDIIEDIEDAIKIAKI